MKGPNAAVHAITTEMEAQRDALLSGDFARLDGMETRLAQAVDRLETAGLSQHDLAMIATLAARNARLLDAARAGAARARSRVLAGSHPALTTYDAHGRQQGVSTAGQTLARR
jgi:hypothetical protein